jgi:hypothetical protein
VQQNSKGELKGKIKSIKGTGNKRNWQKRREKTREKFEENKKKNGEKEKESMWRKYRCFLT